MPPSMPAIRVAMRIALVATRALLPASSAMSATDGVLHARTATRTRPTVVCAPMRATGLGITWRQHAAGEVHAIVRTPASGDGWSRRVRLESGDEPDPGSPDTAAGRRGSSFLWTGGSRCVRVRLDLEAGVRLSDASVVF